MSAVSNYILLAASSPSPGEEEMKDFIMWGDYLHVFCRWDHRRLTMALCVGKDANKLPQVSIVQCMV